VSGSLDADDDKSSLEAELKDEIAPLEGAMGASLEGSFDFSKPLEAVKEKKSNRMPKY